MKVTKIGQQIRDTDQYSVFIDGKYAFSLSGEGLLALGIIQGQFLSEAELVKYKRLAADDRAYALTLAYVTQRMRSEGELTDYFRRKGYGDKLSAKIMERLKRHGLVDDVVFAQRWTESRRLLKPISTKRLRFELLQKKVKDDVIEQVLMSDETDERQVLRDLVAKKRRQSRYMDNQKLMAYLARQGFSYEDIRVVIKED